jgi:hypothetical protein
MPTRPKKPEPFWLDLLKKTVMAAAIAAGTAAGGGAVAFGLAQLHASPAPISTDVAGSP